jgi:two-component system chemotaxis response regulator CheY
MADKVLVVDDDDDIRDLMAMIFVLHGFNVVMAEDGLVGLSKATSEQPDVIITDVSMPHLNGTEMIRRLRQQAEFASLPIIVLSAYGDELRQAALEAGATQTLQKPVDLELLVIVVRSFLPTKQPASFEVRGKPAAG